jgi:site-specific recombinase XerD
MKPTRELVLRMVERAFPRHDPAQILAILDEYGTEAYEGERERVHLAVLFASGGDLLTLHELVDLAKTDYRDVLNFRPRALKEYSAWIDDEE